MKYSSLLFILLAISIISAGQPGKASPKDSTEIRNTITSFYNWYKTDYVKFQQFDLYDGTKTTDQPPYKINWSGVEKYFEFIRTNVPQLGESFISGLRKHFQQADSAFKVELDSEIPYGFDYDWFTNSQEEPSWLLDEMEKATRWAINVNAIDASVDVLGHFMNGDKKVESVIICFSMKKEKGKWTIAQIGCPETYPEESGK